MGTPYLGQIAMFGGNFAPSGWAMCNGQILNIQQNAALFSLIGTYYGGNGTTNFALPNLISRLPVHVGTGLGLSPYSIGEVGGTPTVTITTQTMPAHLHMLNATQALATTGTIANNLVPAQPTGPIAGPEFYANPVNGQPPPTPELMAPAACSFTGGSQPHQNMMPSQCITFIIALQGAYPSRS